MNFIIYIILIVCSADFSNALVGITINDMYIPDPCGAACFSYFQVFSLECSTTIENERLTTPGCRSSSEPYMSSVAWCWELQCTNKTSVSTQKFIEAWNTKLPSNNFSFFDALSSGKPKNSLNASSSKINLKEPALVNDTLFYIYYKSGKDFLDSETYHARMALSLVMITWSLVFFGTLYNINEKFHLDERYLPKTVRLCFRKYLLLPALFNEKCCVPIKLNEGFPIDYVPPRIVAITIIFYYIINIIFCAVPYRGFWEDLSNPHDTASLMYTYVGNRTGVLSFANIPILILFASRNNIFQWLTGWSYATFQHFHRHVSIICVLEAFVHSVCYTIKYVKKPYSAHYYANEAAKPYFWWGILATVACSLMPPLAVLKIRITSYEFFLVTHYILSILFVIGCAYHIKKRFSTEWGYNYWLYCSYAVWGFDFFLRILRCVRLKVKGCKSKAIVEIVDIESKTIKITFKIRDFSQDCVGNYYYIYFFTIFPFFTSHPFTVAEWKGAALNFNSPVHECTTESENEDMMKEIKSQEQAIKLPLPSGLSSNYTFYVQCLKGTTGKIFNRLEQNNFNPFEIFSVLEGPYGSSERDVFQDYDFMILLTGGIGNTVIINYLQSFLDYKERKCFRSSHDTKISILHLDRFKGRLNFLREKLKDIVPPDSFPDIEIQLHDTSAAGRIDLKEYISKKVDKFETEYYSGVRRIGVISCGPAKFNDICRRTCVDLQEKLCQETIISYITDPFEW